MAHRCVIGDVAAYISRSVMNNNVSSVIIIEQQCVKCYNNRNFENKIIVSKWMDLHLLACVCVCACCTIRR